ncbi:MAG: M6 family metalloprotease domain-containing protein [Carboxydocellales bacterium]
MKERVGKSLAVVLSLLLVLLNFTSTGANAQKSLSPKQLSQKSYVMPNPSTYGTNSGGKGFRSSSALQDPTPRRESVARQNVLLAPNRTQKVLVVMMSFTDTPFEATQTAVYYNKILFGAGNSLADYYNRNSYGALTITGDVYEVTSTKAMGDYGADLVDGSGLDDKYGDVSLMANEATKLLQAKGYDYSQYDTDHDNIIDHLMIIHAGKGQEEGPEPEPGNTRIWSHRGGMQEPEPINPSGPLAVNSYTTVPANAKVGVIAHEFGHDLGLPDLYDTDKDLNGESNGAGMWDLMASGSWLGDGETPANLSAWSKLQMGWVTPFNVTTDGNYTINAVENVANAVYRLWTNGDASSKEYFLIENRQDPNVVYRQGSMSLGKGLLVWRINDNIGNFAANNINNNPDNLRVALVEAHSSYRDGLENLYMSNNEGDAGDPFPGSGNKTSFTAISTPDSYSYGTGNLAPGAWSFVEINNISDSRPSMTAKFGVQATVPVLPSPNGPSGVITSAAPGFSWNYVEKAEKYRLQIATNSNFQSGTIAVDLGNLRQLSYTSSALADNKYYWRLAAVNELNSANPTYTGPMEFTVNALNAPPAIATRNAIPNATEFPVTGNIEFTCTEGVDADTVYSVTYTGNVQLKKGSEIVPATITYDSLNRKVIIDPVSNLSYETIYTVSVSGVKDTTGNTIVATTWNFTTASPPNEGSSGGGGGGGPVIQQPSTTVEVTIKTGEAATISSGDLQINIPSGATDEKLTGQVTQLESTDAVYTDISKVANDFAEKVIKAFDFSLSAEDGNYSLKQGLTLSFEVENTDKNYGFYRLDPVFNTLVPIKTTESKTNLGVSIAATIKQPGKLVVLEEKTASFTDLTSNSWAKPYITSLAQKNILSGLNNSKFGPQQELTRGQLAKIITLAAGIPGTYNSAGFKDINAQNNWAIRYIDSAKTAGVISGYQDGSFKPDNAVTRAELIKMIVVANGLKVESQQGDFKDTKGHWAEQYIATAAKAGFISGYSDKSFKPDAPITREEAAKIVAVSSGYVNSVK